MRSSEVRGRAATPAPLPPPPSFLRRHPILAGFGVLAGLSLFGAWWPASAIVTGVVVAARATGADRVALDLLRHGAAAVIARVHHAAPPPAAPPEPPQPPTPAPGPPRRAAPHLERRTVRAAQLRGRVRAAPVPRSRPDQGRHAVAPGERGGVEL